MARYNSHHQILVSDTIDIIRDELRRDKFDGAEDATRIRVYALSGQIDEFTEEVTYFESHNWTYVSGIVHTIGEEDELLGLGGRIKIGDTSVTYHYNSISGVFLNQPIREIELLVPGASGLYQVAGTYMMTLAGQPMYLKVALTLDTNG